MAEFHPPKNYFLPKLLAVVGLFAVLTMGLGFTLMQNKSDWWNRKPMPVKAQAVTEQVVATSYLEYLPIKAQKWARSPDNIQRVFLLIAGGLLSLFLFQMLLSLLSTRGGYDHELVIEQLYQKRFEELKSAFFKLLRKM